MSDMPEDRVPVCDYEGSSYQQTFWDQGDRAYEDQSEAIALRRLLPKGGRRLLEVGAGAGRHTPRYTGFQQVVLLDYSRTQLEQARDRVGVSPRYIYVAADAYRLPFVDGLFDAATMIRVIHHMADAPAALREVRRVLEPRAAFVLEFANKQNLKAIARWVAGRQAWSPFSPEPVEFAELNFDFHPKTMWKWLTEARFGIERKLTVSHFRVGLLKKSAPTALLVRLDAWTQWTGEWWQLSPSVFVRARADSSGETASPGQFFRCPECGGMLPHPSPSLAGREANGELACLQCGRRWATRNGIYDFRQPV